MQSFIVFSTIGSFTEKYVGTIQGKSITDAVAKIAASFTDRGFPGVTIEGSTVFVMAYWPVAFPNYGFLAAKSDEVILSFASGNRFGCATISVEPIEDHIIID